MLPRATITALGVDIDVDLAGLDEADRARLLTAWEWCDARKSAGDDDAIAVSPGTYEEVAHRLSSRITLEAIGKRKNDLLMFHAGAVANPLTGNVVAFVAPSGTGKTTASITLGRRFAYVSDETVGVTDDLEVVPYRKPLSVVQPETHLKEQVSPRSLDLVRLGNVPLRLVAIILLDRRSDFDTDAAPVVERLGLLESIPALVPQLSYLPDRAGALHRLRDVMSACEGVLLVTYGEAESLVPLVTDLLARPAALAFSHEYVRPVAPPPVPGMFSLADHDDVIEEGDSLIVLANRTARVIGGIGPTIWNRLPATYDELRDTVVEQFGQPPEGSADALVTAALNYLVEAGLVNRG